MHRMALTGYIKVANRFREIQEMDRERGLTTTEIAVLTFVLVTVAIAIGAALYQYAAGQVEDLPDAPTREDLITSGGESN